MAKKKVLGKKYSANNKTDHVFLMLYRYLGELS